MAQNPGGAGQGAPGEAEVWNLSGRTFLVYTVPDTDARIMWYVMGGDEKARLFGEDADIDYDKEMDYDQAVRRYGLAHMGTSDRIQSTADHPFQRMVQDLKIEARVKPWLLDPDFMAINARAHIEGRRPSEAEIQNTSWWRNSSEAERDWFELNNQDPATARQTLTDNRLRVLEMFRQVGWYDAPLGIADYYADQWTHGKISEEDLKQKIIHEMDPNAPGASPFAGYYAPEDSEAVRDADGNQYLRIDGKDYLLSGPGQRARYGTYSPNGLPLATDINEVGTAMDYFQGSGEDPETARLGNEEEVRTLVRQWLGPKFAQGYGKDFVAEWASKLRMSPNAKDELVGLLRQQRMAVLPEYENPDLRYEDIAGPWRTVVQSTWGETPDETDPTFLKVLRMNDLQGAETLLRTEGLRRGKRQVVNDFISQAGDAFGSSGIRGGLI